MAKALLIDLDGVVRVWNPQVIADIETRHGLPLGSISSAALSDPDSVGSLHRAVTGQISDEEWRIDITNRFSAIHGAGAESAIHEWSQFAGEVDNQVLQLIGEVRREMPVALISNATSRLHDDLVALGLTSEFDAIISSAELGVAKPEPEIFLAACGRVNVEPADCLLVDDTVIHVLAAEALGLRGHHYSSMSRLRKFIDATR